MTSRIKLPFVHLLNTQAEAYAYYDAWRQDCDRQEIEEWFSFPSEMGLRKYYCSTFGRVYSKSQKVVLAQKLNKAGYYTLTFMKNERTVNGYYPHVLMARALIPNPLNLPTVDHIDIDPLNNNLTNLRWASYITQAANQRDKSERTTGNIVLEMSPYGDTIARYNSFKEAAKTHGINVEEFKNALLASDQVICPNNRNNILIWGNTPYDIILDHGEEEWRSTDGIFELGNDEYFVSSFGRIWHDCDRPVSPGTLYRHYVTHGRFLLHRIICTVFHGEPPEGKNFVDHIDNTSFNNLASNLRWVTKRENSLAYHREQWDGEIKNTTSRPIVQYTTRGLFVAYHTSITLAATSVSNGKSSPASLHRSLSNPRRISLGFYWRHLVDVTIKHEDGTTSIKQVLDDIEIKVEKRIRYLQFKPGVLKPVGIYETLEEAGEVIKPSSKYNIHNCCYGVTGICAGFIWRKLEVDENDRPLIQLTLLDVTKYRAANGGPRPPSVCVTEAPKFHYKTYPVTQLDINENFIRDFDSVEEAGLFYGYNHKDFLVLCMRPETTHGGCYFRMSTYYEDSNHPVPDKTTPSMYDVSDCFKRKAIKKVYQLNKKGKQVAKFTSIKNAIEKTGASKCMITNSAATLKMASDGFFYRFKVKV